MQHKPSWWPLYATFPLSIGLLWLDSRITLPPQGHEFLELGIVVLVFGCMALWMRRIQTPAAKTIKYVAYVPQRDQPRVSANCPDHLPADTDHRTFTFLQKN